MTEPSGAWELEGEVNEVADKKVTPKSAAKKSTTKKSTGEAATRVTLRRQKRMRKTPK